MFRNYLMTALRHIMRNKSFSIINLLGLSLGIAVTLLVSLYVIQESSYNKQHRFGDQIFRVNVKGKTFRGVEKVSPVLPVLAGPTIMEEYPDVENVLRYRGLGQQSLTVGAVELKDLMVMSFDESLFEFFDYELTKGNESTALKGINSIILSAELAKRLFPEGNALEQLLKTKGGQLLKVTGVLSEGSRTHFDFDYVIPFTAFLSTQPEFALKWNSSSVGTYLKLRPETDLEAFQVSISKMLNSKRDRRNIERLGVNEYLLQLIADVYLGSEHITLNPGEKKGDKAKVKMFSIIAIAVLLIACINFINLSTANHVKRAKEVGLRKVIGASKKQLISQFLIESTLTALIAGILAILLADLMAQSFGEVIDQELLLNLYGDRLILLLAIVVLVTGIVAGLYPAWYLASFSPSRTLRIVGKGSGLFRKALFVFQFSIATIFIVVTLIVNKQLNYIEQKDMGFDIENLMYIGLSKDMKNQQGVIIDELRKSPWIKNVSWSQSIPMVGSISGISVKWTEEEKGETTDYINADHNFIETAGMHILKGRGFEANEALENVILNESAARMLGEGEVIGKLFGDGQQVVGVVEDFHYKALYDEIEPVVFKVPSSGDRTGPYVSYLLVSVYEDSRVKGREAIEGTLSDYNDLSGIEYGFLAGSAMRFYTEEEKTARAFTYSAAFSIVISALGLLGLMISAISSRTKELGIRKVMGASAISIGHSLSTHFLSLIAISFFISTPVVVYFMNIWLADFSYRINIGPTEFLAGGIFVMIVSFGVVGLQVHKAAFANPLDSLRHD